METRAKEYLESKGLSESDFIEIDNDHAVDIKDMLIEFAKKEVKLFSLANVIKSVCLCDKPDKYIDYSLDQCMCKKCGNIVN